MVVDDGPWQVLQVYNNNLVLGRRGSDREAILRGKGIGYAARSGRNLPPNLVERVYRPDASDSASTLGPMIASLSDASLVLAERALEIATSTQVGTDFGLSAIIGLADHLELALRRKDHFLDSHPLDADVRYLYPKERIAAEAIVDFVHSDTGTRLPDGEVTAIALHLVNAEFVADSMAETFEMSAVMTQVFDIVDKQYQTTIDRTTLSAARFAAHLRYLYVRVRKNGQHITLDADPLGKSIRDSFPDAFAVATTVKLLLELRLRTELNAEELSYLTIHLARLADQVRTSAENADGPAAR